MSKRRVQIDMMDAAFDQLEKVQSLAGHPTKSETVRRAITIYEALLEEVNAGGTLFLKQANDTTVKLVLL